MDDGRRVVGRRAGRLSPHFKDHPENWPGGFFRDQEVDARIMAENPPPDDFFELRNWRVAGQKKWRG